MGREMWWGDGVSYRMECINKKCGRIVLAEDSMSKETPCPVCGWWNETNDACIYHPDGVEVTA